MDEYKKTIKLDLDIDEYKRRAKELETIKFIDPSAKEDLEKLLADELKLKDTIKEAKKMLDQIEDFEGPEFDKMRKEIEEIIEDAQEKLDNLHGKSGDEEGGMGKGGNAKAAVGDYLKNKARDMLAEIGRGFKQLMSDILSEAKQMMNDIAAYSGNSSLFNQDAVNMKLNYGVSGSQAYALQMAAKDTGFGSFDEYMENFMYADQETLDRFDTLVEKYTQSYEQDQEMAAEWQQFEQDWADMKKELIMEVVHFFSENKETVRNVMKMAIGFMETILTLVGWIAEYLGDGHERNDYEHDQAISDIYKNYGSGNTNNTNVKIDNTFNGVQPQDRGTLEHAGSMTYEQVLAALK